MMPDLTNLYFFPCDGQVVEAVAVHLCDRWPNAFTLPPRPLARGIRTMILGAFWTDNAALRPAGLHKVPHHMLVEAVVVILDKWTSGPLYLAAQKVGAARIALDGTSCGFVTESEAAFAKQRFKLGFKRAIDPLTATPADVGRWLGQGHCPLPVDEGV
jgi:sRNA-binding protein